MADVKPAPQVGGQADSCASVPAAQKSSGRNNHGKRRGNHGSNCPDASQGHDDGTAKNKKPDVEHYRPGAFGSKKPEDEHNIEGQQQKKPQKSRKAEQLADKVANMSLGEESRKSSDTTNNNGGGRKNRKKPDQSHYVPKRNEKEAEGDSGTNVKDEPGSQQQGGGGKKRNKGKGNRGKQQQNEGQKPPGGGNAKGGSSGERQQARGAKDDQEAHWNGDKKSDVERDNKPAADVPPRPKGDHRSEGGNRGREQRGRGYRGQKAGSRNSHNPATAKDDKDSASPLANDRKVQPADSNLPRNRDVGRPSRDRPFRGHHSPSPPHVSSSRRGSGPHHQQNARRSYSPAGNNRVSSPVYGGRGGRGSYTRRGGNRRFHDSRESSDWRSHNNDHHHQSGPTSFRNYNSGDSHHNHYRGGDRGWSSSSGHHQPSTLSNSWANMPPRFQKSRNEPWSKNDEADGSQPSPYADNPFNDQKALPTVRKDSYDIERNGDDEDTPKVSSMDWSAEVEAEEERLELTSRPNRGILRIPPEAMPTAGSNSSDWRRHQPAADWRTGRPDPTVRYLYDHKNPKKPIAAPRGAVRPPGDFTSSRFPMDPRFSHPVPHSYHPQNVLRYRPPFPSMPPKNFSDEHSSMNKPATMEGSEATQIILTNEMRLRNIVHTGGPERVCQLWNSEVRDARHRSMSALRRLLQIELVFIAQNDVEFHVWKICFYNLVATVKTWLKEDGATISAPDKKMAEENMMGLLDEGLDFYSQMLDTLDEAYNIGLEKYYDVLEPRSSDKMIRCALVSAQKCLLCLGDLARYRETLQDTSNYGMARQYYLKASHIDTRNAKPFNQLALLAWTCKRKFEAVYYYMRCLQTRSPVPTCKQSLMEIFEDIRKKWDANEKKRLEEREARRREADSERDRMHLIKGTHLRKEIWIRSREGGSGADSRRLHRTTSAHEGAPDSDEAELRGMSTQELNRRFNNAFLHLVGTLYTNINTDLFPIGCDLLQKEFRILLSRSPLPIDSRRLVQIMALNMFIIEYTRSQMAAGAEKDGYLSVTQNYALQMAFEMFGILVERCNVLLQAFTLAADDNPEEGRVTIFHDEDLPSLLAAVKVWCDWLLGNNDAWYPVVSDEPFVKLAKLATHLERLKPITQRVLAQCIDENQCRSIPNNESYEMIRLDEDAVLFGFAPWSLGLDRAMFIRFAPKSIPVAVLQDARRLDAINFCIDYLEGLENPVLKWSPPDNAHVSLVARGNSPSSTEDKVNARLTSMLSREQDILEESYSDDNEPADGGEVPADATVDSSSKIGRLKVRKDQLERWRRDEEERERRLQQQILSEHVSVTLEVCPKHVVPDTNCFVDYLADIEKLAASGLVQIKVPVVVLRELDGLSKGSRPSKYSSPEHAVMVADNAKRALAFLKERPANTKCVTSRGTVLSSLGVTSEDTSDGDESRNNDDLVLDSCVNLSEDREEIRGNMRVVYRDVVLLTEDRNLKLKAHTTDMPVNKLADFLHWAYNS